MRSTPQREMVKTVDEQEVPSVANDAPATKRRKMEEALCWNLGQWGAAIPQRLGAFW
jgi:hypothetical protein